VTNKLARPYRLAALKLICLQGVVALVAAVIIFVGWGVDAGLSAIAGGTVAVLPNFVNTKISKKKKYKNVHGFKWGTN
jgi:ATP synthase protein I